MKLPVNLASERREIGIFSANDDTCVCRVQPMQADEVVAIVGKDGAFVLNCELQQLVIWNGFIVLPRVERSQDIVSQFTQGNDHRKREILVRIEPGDHESSPLAAISRSISSR